MQVKEGFSLFGLHFSAFRSCASAHGGVPGASWLASAYPDCTDQQSLGMDQASVMHHLPEQEGQLARPRPAMQPLHRPHDGPASTALLSPALSPQRHCPREGILPESNQASKPPNPQVLVLFTKGLLGPRHPTEDFRLNEGSMFFLRKKKQLGA